jgi:hypothetical protein
VEEPVPVSYVIDHTSLFIRVHYADPYSFDDWRRMIDELRVQPAFIFRRHIGVLSDRTEVGPAPQLFTQLVGSYLATHAPFLRDRRIAIVVRDVESALSVWPLASLCEAAGAVCALFESRPEAEGWLLRS